MTNSPREQKAMELDDQGRRLLQEGRLEEAIACFRQAWEEAGLTAARNNWATALYFHGKPDEALHVLEPLLDAALIHPFSHALASRCHSALGDTKKAREHLRKAIRDFDAGRFRLHTQPDGGQAWIEYTMIIKDAAADLGEYRLILELHNRWPGRDLAHGAFVAGVAAFNLGKYTQAIRIWQRVRDPQWVRPLQGYTIVAGWAERGVIPPFRLEARMPDTDRLRKLTPDELAELPMDASLRLLMLVAAFDAAAEHPDEDVPVLAELIRHTGDWGIDLGRRILEAATVPRGLKLSAAHALTEAGVFQPGEPIPMVIDGRRTEVVVQMKRLADGPIPELDEVLAEARSLWQKGKRKAAMKLLTDLHDNPVVYPPAVMQEADFLRQQGKLDEALILLEMMDNLMPNHPYVLFNMAAVYLEKGDADTVRQLLDAIDPEDLPPVFQEDLASMKDAIGEEDDFIEDVDAYIASFLDSMREEEDERPIRPDVKLTTALRRIPVQWLNAAAQRLAIEPQRRRPEREKAVAAALLDSGRVRAALAEEPPAVREALDFVLAEGGWVKLHRLTHRFGDQTGDGFHWDEQPPASTIGRLRMLGILHVGRAPINGRNHKVAVVPVELRELLG